VASNWNETSELARFNAAAATSRTVPASADLYDVLARATAWSVKTHGAFDATVEPLTRAYDLRGAGRIPAENERAKAAALVRGPAVTLDPATRTVTLPLAGMAFDLGGVAKGWAIDRAVETLKAHGVTSALVNFGGQVYALGAPLGADAWTVEIASPTDRAHGVVTLQLKDRSLSTSCASERAVNAGGTMLNHILDPGTGRPAAAWGSASAIAASATDADCASTALYVMGAEKGLAWAQGQADLEAVFLTPDAKGVRIERTSPTVALFAAAPAQNEGAAPSAQELARRIDVLAGEVDDLKVGDVAQPAGESHAGLGPAASKVYGVGAAYPLGAMARCCTKRSPGRRTPATRRGRAHASTSCARSPTSATSSRTRRCSTPRWSSSTRRPNSRAPCRSSSPTSTSCSSRPSTRAPAWCSCRWAS
jgi:thiamine biosynthesis lipoprotein